MQKKHESPEFTVIKQNEANAKFFVASGPTPPTPAWVKQFNVTAPGMLASTFGEGDEIGGDSAW